MNSETPAASAGFTVLEVLVALAIIAFGLIAAFGQLNQSATSASRLRDQTFAHWVALNEIAKLRLGGVYPAEGTQTDDLEMANTRWQFKITISKTESDLIRRADVSVALADQPEHPVATATGFLAERPQTPASALVQPGWPPLTAGEEAEPESEAPPPEAPGDAAEAK